MTGNEKQCSQPIVICRSWYPRWCESPSIVLWWDSFGRNFSVPPLASNHKNKDRVGDEILAMFKGKGRQWYGTAGFFATKPLGLFLFSAKLIIWGSNLTAKGIKMVAGMMEKYSQHQAKCLSMEERKGIHR